MKAKPYNPCADGYVAKCWECLRRNEAFRKTFDSLPESGEHNNFDWLGNENGLAAQVILTYEEWKIDECSSSQKVEQQAKFRVHFSKGERFIPSDDYAEKPFPGAELAAFKVDRSKFDTVRTHEERENAVLDLLKIWLFHDLIAVPKKIRHDKHRKKILADIDAQIPKSLFRAITLKNDGRWLGTESDWDIYNLYEGWIKSAYSEKEAQQLTAHEINGEDFGTTKKQRRERASSFLKKAGSQTFTGKNKRNPETRDAIKIIKDSIASVFPKFEPYCPPGKRNKATLNSKRSD